MDRGEITFTGEEDPKHLEKGVRVFCRYLINRFGAIVRCQKLGRVTIEVCHKCKERKKLGKYHANDWGWKEMKVLVLAGGEGTRLAPYTTYIPKPLFPIGGKPVSRIIIERLIEFGLENIVLCINKRFEKQFRHEFRDLKLHFSVTPSPQGTAGEVYAARDLIDTANFMVVYSDDLTEIDYKAFIEFHKLKQADATLCVTRNVPLEVGVVDIDEEGRVLAFREKPSMNIPVWTGTAIFRREALKYFGEGLDIAKNVFPRMLEDGKRVYAYEIEALWLDIGSISHYKRALEVFGKDDRL
ncbi:MAG: nucleotidyltransferase family protein [Candidatus Methanospirareceae archaeon]